MGRPSKWENPAFVEFSEKARAMRETVKRMRDEAQALEEYERSKVVVEARLAGISWSAIGFELGHTSSDSHDKLARVALRYFPQHKDVLQRKERG